MTFKRHAKERKKEKKKKKEKKTDRQTGSHDCVLVLSGSFSCRPGKRRREKKNQDKITDN